VTFVALLDANVLWSAPLRDTILRAARRDLFRPAWTEAILAEVAGSLKRRRPDLDPERIDRTVGIIHTKFPAALVEGYEALIPIMQNDQGDRHVLAAAVRAGAQVIVTSNVRDFPAAACSPYDIDIQPPDEFLCHLWHLRPPAMAQILREQAADLHKPPQTPRQVLDTLERSVPTFVATALQSQYGPWDS